MDFPAQLMFDDTIKGNGGNDVRLPKGTQLQIPIW